MRNLINFDWSSNPVDYIPPNVQRLINRITNTARNVSNNSSIYNDSQSVHNHSIQECVKKSIQYILSIKPTITESELGNLLLENKLLSEKSKQLIFEYIASQEIHCVLSITFGELLLNLYSIVIKNENRDEIFKILSEEMQNAECKCFTGRVNRLVSCLAGFDSNIQIQISEGEQISNIISQIKKKLEEDSNYSIELHKKVANEHLLELYEQSIIDDWLKYIE